MATARVSNHIGGEWVGSESTLMGDVCCPARGENIATVPYGIRGDVDKALTAANAAGIYTSSGAAAREFKYRVKPSMIGVNLGFPFGGAGNSMHGDIKAHGKEIFLFFTEAKVVIERWF